MRVVQSGISSDVFSGTCSVCRCEVEATRGELTRSHYGMYGEVNNQPVHKVHVSCPECSRSMTLTQTSPTL